MSLSLLRLAGAKLRALESRLDAWAAKRLSPEEYAEALDLDRRLKRHFWRWLGFFALGTLFFAAIAVGIFQDLGWRRAVFFSAIGCMYLLFAVLSPWYGYRKWTKNPPWKVFAWLVALTLAGAAVGFGVASFERGDTWASIRTDKLTKAIATALLLGLLLASLLVGISRMRLREAVQRAARLQAEAERERLARQGTQAELKLLQAQVEPHFLFNTLANVRHLVQTGSPQALPMLDHLIHYLRTALPEMRGDGSTLGREAELARAYLEIMRLRMGGALEFSIDIPAPLQHAAFPPLMLITLVENAIKHGVAPRGRGRVRIAASESAAGVRLVVEDDGRGLGGDIGQGVGLQNVRERLRALHGDAARFELEGLEPAGARATIDIPR